MTPDYDDLDIPPPPHAPPLLSPEALHQLCTLGYVGIDLPPALAQQFETLKATADTFFAQPDDAKFPYKPSAALGPPTAPTNTERGYTCLPDEKEFLTLRRTMTHLPKGIRPVAFPLWHDTAHLLHRILVDIGGYLGLPPWAWDGVVHDSLDPGLGPGPVPRSPRDDPPTLLRLFRYELGGGGAERHRDLGLLTMCVCWGSGLQVRPPLQEPAPSTEAGAADGGGSSGSPPRLGDWVDAPRVTVMAGDTLYVLSGHRIPSAIHRVVVDPAEVKEKERKAAEQAGQEQAEQEQAKDTAPVRQVQPGRRSIVFALRATVAGELNLEPLGMPGSVNAAELFCAIKKQRVNINQGKDTRDAMRAKLQREKDGGNDGNDSNEPATGVDDGGGKVQDEEEEAGEKKMSQPVGVA